MPGNISHFRMNCPAESSREWRLQERSVNRPDILLADEPTGNLDPKTSEEIMKLLEQINETRHNRAGSYPQQRNRQCHEEKGSYHA